jgi:putative phosphonate metabolism protein
VSAMRAMSAPRYAVYFAPAVGSPWWRFGAGWLGWDEQGGLPLAQPSLPEFPAHDFHELTAEPRRYGFHATLKAPFRLRLNVDEELVRSRLAALARRLRPVALGAVLPRLLDDFVALVPAQHRPAVGALAAVCVLDLDDLRAPLTPEELERRRPERLDVVGRDLLRRFGYPHVLDRFRFHMTLSGTVDPVTADLLVNRAQAAVAPLNAAAPLTLDRICLFREDHAGAPFQRIHEEELRP